MNIPAHPQSEGNDPLYEACHAYLAVRHATLWSDFILPDNIIPAARWLSSQIQGVAEHYDATDTPFFAGGGLTAPYAGPYSTETRGGGQRPTLPRSATNEAPYRPSALVTHGQQPERW